MSRNPDRLVRLDVDNRILSREECEAIAQRVFRAARGGGETRVRIGSWWQGELRWGRNRVSLASDRRDVSIAVSRGEPFEQLGFPAQTNQLDDASIDALVRAAERARARSAHVSPAVYLPKMPPLPSPDTKIWSDATYGLTAEARGELARSLVSSSEAQRMLSAGYAEVRAATFAEMSSTIRAGSPANFETPYAAWTQAQCSMTVRDSQGTGSGWAGLSSYDWAKLDNSSLAERALDKCLRSRNPVALEPGRYTVILEPQAVADLMEAVIDSLSRENAESGRGPFVLAQDEALGIIRTKLGLKVMDERISISHDYADPALGVVPEVGAAGAPVSWIDHGVLSALSYDRDYALTLLGAPLGLRRAQGYRMSGGTTTQEEMIQSTKRGLLVTRFSNIGMLDETSLLCTGLTRDGLWLIENGKITKPVKNFRFTESPLFVLNNLEQLGEPVPVFRPTPLQGGRGELTPAIVPALKARDFSFTSLVDAV